MWGILLYLPPLAMVVVANLGVARRPWRILTYVLLGFVNAAALFLGLVFAAAPHVSRLETQTLAPVLQSMDTVGLGLALTAAAMLGFVLVLPSWRRFLARHLAIAPASPVHATALTMLVYLAAISVGLLFSNRNLVRISIEIANVAPETVALGQVLFLVFALAGVGLGIRRDARQTLARLGLRAPTLYYSVIAAGMVGAFLCLDYATAWTWHQLWPASYHEVMASTQQLFSRFTWPSGTLMLALSAGIGEEILFRGALQPRFRIPVTAAVFALGHVQYALSPAIVEIFIVGLALGWLRERANTTTCIAVHASYNFVDAMLMPYFP